MENPPSCQLLSLLLINHSRFKRLYLKLLGTSGRYLHGDIFVESNRQEVRLSLNLLPPIAVKDLQFLRIPIQPLEQHILEVLIMREDEEANAEDAVDLSTEVLEVDLREVFDLELDARRHEELLHVFVDVEHAEALLDGVDLLRVLALQELHRTAVIFIV